MLVTGSGASGAIAARAAHMLSVCGCPAFYFPPDDGLHGGLGVLQRNDLLIALSKGGGSAALNEFSGRAKSLCRAVIAVTAALKSALAGIADHFVALKLDDDADLGGVVATGSSLATAAVLDALSEVARVSRGYDWRRLLFTHPSGAVGRDAAQTIERLTRSSTEERRGPGCCRRRRARLEARVASHDATVAANTSPAPRSFAPERLARNDHAQALAHGRAGGERQQAIRIERA